MTKLRSAGDLDQRVAFDKREETNDPDDDGNYVGKWVEQFQCSAGFIHLRGGESVLASRLQGQHVQVIFVRACSQTRTVTTDWRIRDVRTGATFNIRDVTPTKDRAWVDFLCQSGGADG
jgi:SPP1 family predicted phage head-tail adaptor